MAQRPTWEYQVRVIPIETGYALSVTGLRQFVVADGYEGSLDQVARELIAAEVDQPVEAITVHLRYDLMTRYRRPPQFNWPILLLGLGTLSATAIGLALLDPVLISIGSFGTFALIVTRLVGLDDEDRPRVE